MNITFGQAWFHNHYVKKGDWNKIIEDLKEGKQKVYENQIGHYYIITDVVDDPIDRQRITVREFLDEKMAYIALGIFDSY